MEDYLTKLCAISVAKSSVLFRLICSYDENHRYLLIKYIIEKYLTIKLYHIGKLKNESLPNKLTRQQYTKICFLVVCS